MVLVTCISSCLTCDDCEPSQSEPYIKLNFYTKAHLTPSNITIQDVNGIMVQDVTFFEDTTSQFLLPLPMQHDTSLLVLTYYSGDDLGIENVDTIQLSHDRLLELTPKNILKINYLNTEILMHTFDSLALVCKDTIENCNSRESTLKAYF